MKCQYCHSNEAENTFIVNFGTGEQEVHLCDECTQKAKQYYETMRRAAYAGALQRAPGGSDFPEDAGGEIRRKRRLNSLRARLAGAVDQEQYEEAARLRDQIAVVEKDVVNS